MRNPRTVERVNKLRDDSVNVVILLRGIRQRGEHVSKKGTHRVECELCVRARVHRELRDVHLSPSRELLQPSAIRSDTSSRCRASTKGSVSPEDVSSEVVGPQHVDTLNRERPSPRVGEWVPAKYDDQRFKLSQMRTACRLTDIAFSTASNR